MNDGHVAALVVSPARKMRRRILSFGLLTALVLAVPAAAQQIPALLSLPPGVDAAHPELVRWRARLVAERDDLRTKTAGQNRRCSAVETGSKNEKLCRDELSDLTQALKLHIDDSDRYNAAVRQAETAPPAVNHDAQAGTAAASTATGKPLAWEEDHPERKAWSGILRKEIESNLQVLEKSDIKEWAPNYENLSESQKIDVWASLFVAIASFEDPQFKTDTPYRETKILNKKTGKYYTPFPSIGLFQLSYKEQTAYGWEHVDVKAKSLEDPLVNIRCGVKVLTQLVKQDGVIAVGGDHAPRGGARYWSVLQEGHNINKIRDMVRKQALAE